jgi:ATP-binding cassette subfamily B protein/subfamily B ATP-binding cassette protein MsbA
MKTVRLIFRFAKKYIPQLLITVISMILLVGVQLLIPWIIKTLIAAVSEGSLDTSVMDYILKLTLLAGGVYLLRVGLFYFRSYMAHIAGWGVVADVRKYLYRHIQRLSLRFYADKQTGQMMSRLVNDTDRFESLIAHAVPDIAVNLLTFIGVGTMLILMNWKLGLLSLVPVPLVVLAVRFYSKKVRPAFRHRQVELGNLNAVLNDNISGIREIKAFTREHIEAERINIGIDRYRSSLLHALKMMAIFHPTIEFFSSLGTLIVIYFGGQLAFNEVLPVSDLVAFFLYLEMLYQPIRNLSMSWENVQEALASADRVEELMRESVDIKDSPNAKVLSERAPGGLKFNHVSFEYLEGETVLEDVDLTIPARKVVALVGPTGVGKSTMVSLIPRFYDLKEGSIELDGVDIRDIQLESLRRQISIVLQDVFLFHGTVKENILFGNPEASEDEINNAAKIANAHEFISDLPEGYDTLIGERGVKLSGGQKQRLSIARAVLKDAPILILDEATSSVDTETEMLIQQALERLIAGKTTIIIAHRLSTIRKADQIVVLEGTGIKEKGSHDELIALGGLYKKLVSIQQDVV